jgi:hypothetical protein
MESEITINELLSLCCYGVHINIMRADNGKVVINGAAAIKRSKDKRQAAKWNAFKDRKIYGIRPSVQIEGIKRGEHFFLMCIDAWISKYECEEAIAEYKANVN